MDTDSFIVYVKANDIYKNNPEDADTRFDTLNFELNRALPKGKNRKVIWLMKDKLGGQITKEFVRLRAKTYNYLKDSNATMMKIKKQKAQKSVS